MGFLEVCVLDSTSSSLLCNRDYFGKGISCVRHDFSNIANVWHAYEWMFGFGVGVGGCETNTFPAADQFATGWTEQKEVKT